MSKNKIYFSNSIQGIRHKDPEFGWSLVKYMQELGFNVLSEHVAARNTEEKDALFFKNTGIDIAQLRTKEPWYSAYEVDMRMVDEAHYLIAIVDGPSHGVGMEIMRALMKEERGLNKTEILCLIANTNYEKVTWMLKGVSENYNNYNLKTYKDTEDAKRIIKEFLNV